MSVCEVEELKGDALLVGGAAEGGEKHVDKAGISWTLVETIVLEGAERYRGVGDRNGSWL